MNQTRNTVTDTPAPDASAAARTSAAPPAGANNHAAATPERVLEAASRVFADHGFEQATVRQICQLAGANVAAVNYHFRDKEGLYREVVLNAHRAARAKYPLNAGVSPADPPEARLRAFIKGHLQRVFDNGHPPWGKLMAREMLEPTSALDGVVEEGIKPQQKILAGIVRELLGPGADDESVRLCCGSIIGQVLVYKTGREVMVRLFQDSVYTSDHIDLLAAHITRFSLSAIRGYLAAKAAGDGAAR